MGVDSALSQPNNWEKALALFFAPDPPIVPRGSVSDPAWVHGGKVQITKDRPPVGPDANRTSWLGVDFWKAIPYTGKDGWASGEAAGWFDVDKWVVLGININRSMFDRGADSILTKWDKQFDPQIQPLRLSPFKNAVASRPSFWTAFETIRQVGTWADTWDQNFRTWAGRFDEPGAEWSGSAAGQFKEVLKAFSNLLHEVKMTIAPQDETSIDMALINAVLEMERSTLLLDNAHSAYITDVFWTDPWWRLWDAFDLATGVGSLTVNPSYNIMEEDAIVFNGGALDPRNVDSQNKISDDAKTSWLISVGRYLDPNAKLVLDNIRKVYGESAATLEAALFNDQPTLVPPKPKAPPSGNNGKPGPDDPQTIIDKLQKDQAAAIDKLKKEYEDAIAKLKDGYEQQIKDLIAQGKANNQDSSDAIDKLNADYQKKIEDLQKQYEEQLDRLRNGGGNQPPVTLPLDSTQLFSRSNGPPPPTTTDLSQLGAGFPSGSTVGPNGVVLGPDGRPITGPDGRPVTVPLGSGIRDQGQLLGPNGNPNTNPLNPNLLLPPAGSTLQPGNGILGPNGQPVTGPDGKPITVPAGSTLSPQNVILGPDHRPILGPDGQPITAPGGSTIRPDGTVLGPDGQPILGPDGRQVTVPQGSTLQPQNVVLGPDGKPILGADGHPITTPSGSTLQPQNSLLGPDGKPILGADGKPITVPIGSSIGPGGSVLGPDGRPITVNPSGGLGSPTQFPPPQVSLPLPPPTSGTDLPPTLTPPPTVPPPGVTAPGTVGALPQPTPGTTTPLPPPGGSTRFPTPGSTEAGQIPGDPRLPQVAVTPPTGSQLSSSLSAGSGGAGANGGNSQPPFIPPMMGGGGGGGSDQPKPRSSYPLKEAITPRKKVRKPPAEESRSGLPGARTGASDRITTTGDGETALPGTRRPGPVHASASTTVVDGQTVGFIGMGPVTARQKPKEKVATKRPLDEDDDIWGADPEDGPTVIGR
jgi:gas vesicle protein